MPRLGSGRRGHDAVNYVGYPATSEPSTLDSKPLKPKSRLVRSRIRLVKICTAGASSTRICVRLVGTMK